MYSAKNNLFNFLVCLIALIFVACSPNQAEEAGQETDTASSRADSAVSFPVTVTDEGGTDITFDQPVERIVCLTATCIDNLHVLGIQPIAVSDVFSLIYERLYEDNAEDVAIIGTNGGFQPDIEQLIALEPDVVMGQLGIMDAMREPIEAGGDIKVHLSYTNNVTEVKNELRAMASITGDLAPAEAAIANFDATMADFQAKIPNETASLMIVFGPSGSDTMFLETTTAQTCATLKLYELADCPFDLPENAGAFGAFGFAEFTYEAILAEDPEIVFFGGYDERGEIDPTIIEMVNANSLWQSLSAVKNDQVYPIEAWKYSGSGGITLVELGVRESMETLYPDAFSK